MPGAFLYADLVAAASLTGAAATVASMPLSNLQDPQPRLRTRFVGTVASVVADFGGAQAVDVVAAISTNATAAATVRVRLSTADATGAAGDAWDSGTISAATSAEYNGNVVVIRGAGTASGRYLRLDLTDAALAAVDIGRLVAGALWRTARAHAFGIEEGREIRDTRDANAFTGAEFPVPAVMNPRTARFSLPALSTAEARGALRALVRQLGAAGDGLWVPDLSLSQAETNARSIWGALNRPGASAVAAHRALGIHDRSFVLVERG